MWGKLSVGLVGLLGIYLLIRSLFKNGKTPNKILDAFDKGFKDSGYDASKQNWIDVSKMETAGWSSPLFINGLNLWGMKKAKVRPNTQTSFTQQGQAGRNESFFSKFFPNVSHLMSEGVIDYATKPLPSSGSMSVGNDWAKYNNLSDAVQDIILWMKYTNFPTKKLSLRDHIEEMAKRKYFVGEDTSTYLSKVLAWQKRNLA
jgi:hypothetical protein